MMRRLLDEKHGAVAVEFALVGTLMVLALIILVELMAAFFQWNSAQRAVRAGARLASVSAPVAGDIATREWAAEGDYVPAYARTCSGATQTCSEGAYDSAAMSRILFGADGACEPEPVHERRGMCDIFPLVEEKNVSIEYRSSLNEVFGAAGGLQPLVTVTLSDVPLSYGIISRAGDMIVTLPETSATVIAQDLSNGG